MFRVAGRILGPLKKIYLTTPAFAPSLSMSAIHIRGRGSIVKKSRFGIRIALFAAVLPSAFAIAQQTAPAPVPAAIRTATKIFVSNAGADSGLFPSPFTGDTNRGYNQLYAGLRANSQYELVGDPAEADLVLELQLTAPAGSTRSMSTNKVNGASDPVPMFRLVVYDRKTHYVLWVFTESIEIAYLKKTHDRNFDDALNAILFEFESLSGKAQAVTH
jgi:hypothetical protein